MVKPNYSKLEASVGGKGYSLNILNKVANVPPFSIVDQSFFHKFCFDTELEKTLAYYWRLATLEEQLPLDNARDAIIRHFLHYPMSEQLQIDLEKIFNSLPVGTKIARSSASIEDGREHSWAGMFYSVVGIESFEEWLVAVRLCWAAVATSRVSNYARKVTPRSNLPSISVILQQAIDSVISGVVFSRNPTQSDSSPLIEATWGQGMPLVSGMVTPERWSFDNNSPKLIQQVGRGIVFLLGSKRPSRPGEFEKLLLPNGHNLLLRSTGALDDGYWRGVSVHNKEISSVISEDIAREIFSFCLERQNQRSPVELEWTIDSEGKIWWLQERPITSLSRQSSSNIANDEFTELLETDVLIRGVTGSQGSANGLGWYPEGGVNTENWTDSRILFQKYTTPEDVPNIVAASAVVTQDGGLLSHTAIVCREIGIPCIVGATPFPPKIDVDTHLYVNANLGIVSRYSNSETSGSLSSKLPTYPLVIIKSPPQKYQYDELVRWWCTQDLVKRIPDAVIQHLETTACIPGILGPLDVLPDVRLSQPKLGFPIGVTFRSERIHPTAVGDCGDGFLVAEVRGVSKHQLLSKISDLLSLISNFATTPNNQWKESIFGKCPSLDEIGENGLLSLQHNSYISELIPKVQFSGRVEAGCFRDLPLTLREKAVSYLFWTGESGHFLEFLSDSPSNNSSDGKVFLFLHTGSADIGLEFLRYAVRVGTSRSTLEGFDSPDSITKGLWGLDITSVLGSTLAANMLALTNYGFVRRAILLVLINSIFQQIFGETVNLQLIFDMPHSFVRVDGDAVVHSQGVQHIEPSTQASFMLTGSPRVSSYIFQCNKILNKHLISHGKVNFGYNPDLLRADFSCNVAKSCILIGSSATHDVAIADAQAREAAIIAQSQLPGSSFQELFPLVCIRGILNGQRKII